MWVFSFRGGLRAGCESISTGAQYVTPDRKIIVKKSKCAGLAQKIGFSALNSSSFKWRSCAPPTKSNKLDLTAAQYF
jgi:hypothetical protein